VAFLRREGGKQQLAKMKPVAGATPQILGKALPVAINYSTLQWSPNDDWIAYPSAEGISMISPDGNTVRQLTAHNLLAFAYSYAWNLRAFQCDGRCANQRDADKSSRWMAFRNACIE
jgi:hypothetical protein